jgi:hypothetical protein
MKSSVAGGFFFFLLCLSILTTDAFSPTKLEAILWDMDGGE